MYHYRIYPTDRLAKITAPAITVQLLTDSDAFAEALQLVTETQGVEVWRNRRLVCRMPPKPAVEIPRSSPDPATRAMYRPD